MPGPSQIVFQLHIYIVSPGAQSKRGVGKGGELCMCMWETAYNSESYTYTYAYTGDDVCTSETMESRGILPSKAGSACDNAVMLFRT